MPIAGIPATWLQSGAAVANLGFTPPPNTRTVTGTGMLGGGGDLSVDRTLNLAAIAGNSVVANVTGSSAVPTAVALPSCPDTGGNHLNYSSGVFSCGISGGGGGSISVTDGATTVNPASALMFGSSFIVTNVGGGNAQVKQTVTTNSQAGSTYTIAGTDAEKEVLMTNGSATTVSLIDGATAGNGFGFGITCNAGCTINRAGSDTINGATSLVLGAFDSAWFRGNGGTGWRASITSPVNPRDGGNLTASTVTSAKLASKSGNGTTVVTTTGAQTSGKCVTIDANGNHVADANACGGGGGGGSGYGNLMFTTAANTLSGTAVYVGAGLANTTTTNSRPIPVPYNMTVDKLYCWTPSAPGAGITYTWTLNVDGSDNTNQQVAGTNVTDYTTGTDTPVSLTRGQKLVIHLTFSGGTPGIYAVCTMRTQAS